MRKRKTQKFRTPTLKLSLEILPTKLRSCKVPWRLCWSTRRITTKYIWGGGHMAALWLRVDDKRGMHQDLLSVRLFFSLITIARNAWTNTYCNILSCCSDEWSLSWVWTKKVRWSTYKQKHCNLCDLSTRKMSKDNESKLIIYDILDTFSATSEVNWMKKKIGHIYKIYCVSAK